MHISGIQLLHIWYEHCCISLIFAYLWYTIFILLFFSRMVGFICPLLHEFIHYVICMVFECFNATGLKFSLAQLDRVSQFSWDTKAVWGWNNSTRITETIQFNNYMRIYSICSVNNFFWSTTFFSLKPFLVNTKFQSKTFCSFAVFVKKKIR